MPAKRRNGSDGPVLEEQVTVGSTPGAVSGSIAAQPGQLVQVRALAEREYVAGSPLTWYVSSPMVLPWAIDDVTTDMGSDLYERILLDAQARGTVNIYRAGIMEEGVNLTTVIDDDEADGYRQAADLVDDAERMLSNLSQSLDDTLWDMLEACALGNRVAEQVYELDRTLSGKQQYVLRTLATKPQQSTAFVVDAYLNVVGILGRIPGQPFAVQQGTLLADIQHVANLLPRSKFAVLTFRPRNNDPRGQSLLRAAFDPWNQKQQLKREYLKYLTQFASPSLAGFTAPNAETYTVMGPDGLPLLDSGGKPLTRSPEDDMLDALVRFQNGSAAAFPNGADIKPIQMSGDGSAFLSAFEFLDRQITKAVLHQTLATEEGQHQTRASSGTHKDILDTITRQGKRPVERMVERDILQTWVRLNYGEKAVRLTPKVTLGTAEQEDRPALWTATAALQTSGYFTPDQLPQVDEEIGVPVRAPVEQATGDRRQATEGAQRSGEQEDGTAPAQAAQGQQGQEQPHLSPLS
jgi:hypothetical protein